MKLSLSFSWVGVAVFALPMLINIAYVIFPPAGEAEAPKNVARWLEVVESVSRIAYLVVLTVWVSSDPPDRKSVWLMLAAVFLLLYYIVWIRYFSGGRDIALLKKPFLFVPVPLAVFPVLYYLFAEIWMGNYPAAVMMIVFGAAHITVSVQSFH